MSELAQRLLATLAEPSTAKACAASLGTPVGRLYHHLDRLLADGRIVVVGEQRRRAVVERTFQATAPAGPRAAVEALLARAPDAAVATARLRLTPERRALLQARLAQLLAALESPDGEETEVVLLAAPYRA